MTKKEEEILKWHWAGKAHSWICRKYKVTRVDIENLFLKHAQEAKEKK